MKFIDDLNVRAKAWRVAAPLLMRLALILFAVGLRRAGFRVWQSARRARGKADQLASLLRFVALIEEARSAPDSAPGSRRSAEIRALGIGGVR